MRDDHSTLPIRNRVPNTRSIQIGKWEIQLLPRAPYEVSYVPKQSIIGFSFEAQAGTHAFASDRKSNYQARPNCLAFVPRGCNVYSQSTSGGEYLRISYQRSSHDELDYGRRFSDVVCKQATDAAFAIRRAMLSGSTLCTLQTESLLMILATSVTTALTSSQPASDSRGWMTAIRLIRINDFIEANLGSKLTVSKIAFELKISTGFLTREFQTTIGQSPYQYILEKRISHARHLMQTTRDLTSIAYESGFSSHSHMTEQFRLRLGVTPRDLRRAPPFCGLNTLI